MTRYNDTSGVSDQIRYLQQQIQQLQTQPRAISTGIDRGGTQSSDYDGSGINAPGTRGWMIGTDETTGVGYVNIQGISATELDQPRRRGAPYIAVQPNAPFINYGGIYHKLGYLKTKDGIVSLSGLIQNVSASNSILFTLPVGYRPDAKIMFGVMMGSLQSRVDIFPNGDVLLYASVAGQYLSLSGIMFPAAGVATWTNMTLASGWSDYTVGDPTWAPCSYWKDQYGRVWLRGLAKYNAGGVLAADSKITDLPASKLYQSHYPTVAADVFGGLHITSGTGGVQLVAKAGTTGTWVSLTRAMFVDDTVYPNWVVDDLYFNSWVKYPGGFPPPSYMIFPDRIVFRDGLVNGGAVGTTMQVSIPGASPDIGWKQNSTSGAELFYCNSNNVQCRIDINNTTYTETPRVSMNYGNTGWVSYGAINYVIGY